MAITYIHVRKLDPYDWTDKFVEVIDDQRVSRMVTVETDGAAVSNSVALMAHRHGAYSDAAYADSVHGDKGPCIVGGFPESKHYEEYWTKQGCTFEIITAGEFHRRLMRSRPDL